MYLVNITDIAEEDILTIIEYITDNLKAPKAANDLLDNLEKHEKILEENPNIYPLVSDKYLAEKGIKFILIKNYMMFFAINENKKQVNIIRFLYGRRDWQNILKNDM